MKMFLSFLVCLMLQFAIINGQNSRTCITNDDPHMTTFDNTRVDYHATCEFIYAEACNSNSLTSIGLPDFEIYGQHDKCSVNQGNWKPSCTKIIGLRIGGFDIKLQRNGAQVDVKLNGGSVFFFPVNQTIGSTQVDVYNDAADPQQKVIETSFGLKIRLRPGMGSIELDSTLALQTQNRLCGACGQHNYITGNDDFTWADGTQFNRIQQSYFAFVPQNYYDPYVTVGIPAGCTLDPRFDTSQNSTNGARRRRQARDECSRNQLRVAKKFCSIILKPRGPFSVCLSEIESKQAYQDCINDMCIDSSFGCANLDGYSVACGEFGQLGAWRSESGCDLECGNNQVYSTIISSECVPTCADPDPCPQLKPNARGLSRKVLRNGNFEEGCMCKEGYVFNGNECVPRDTCAAAVSADEKCQGLFGRKKARCLKNQG